jgi:hypothetical protein
MSLEDEINALIKAERDPMEELEIEGTDGAIFLLVGWLNGIQDALGLVAREIDELKSLHTQ